MGFTFIPPRDINSGQRLYASWLPSLDTVASLAFRTLSTLFATQDLVSLFQLTATSRVCLQGFFPSTQEMTLVASSLPSRRFIVATCMQLPTYASDSDAALKALHRVEIRSSQAR